MLKESFFHMCQQGIQEFTPAVNLSVICEVLGLKVCRVRRNIAISTKIVEKSREVRSSGLEPPRRSSSSIGLESLWAVAGRAKEGTRIVSQTNGDPRCSALLGIRNAY